jgi:WD40 repeat protein
LDGVTSLVLGTTKDYLVTGCNDCSFKVLSSETYKMLYTKTAHHKAVKYLALTHGDSMLITGIWIRISSFSIVEIFTIKKHIYYLINKFGNGDVILSAFFW